MMVGREWFHDGILVERTVDNGDGTGTRTTFHPDGTVDTVEQLTGLPIPPAPTPDPYAVYAAAIEAAQTLQEVRAAGAALRQALEAS